MTLLTSMGIAFALFVFGAEEDAYWDWQLSEPFDLSVNVRVLALDADGFAPEQIAALRARGVKPVCYVSIGTWEEYREDAGQFPAEVIGKPPGNWPEENYLDIRSGVVFDLMAARFERCKANGFLAVEADNLGAYDEDTGFDYSRDDMLNYALRLHDVAEGLGLQMAQKNAGALVPALVDKMDFAMVESCFRYDECDDFLPYVAAGKDVLVAEYEENGIDWDAICEEAKSMGYKLILKEMEIVAGGKSCN